MRKLYIISVILIIISSETKAQKSIDERKIIQTCITYLEGFYQGDSSKIISSIKPSLYKLGYWKNKASEDYSREGNMTYNGAIDYANNVLKSKKFAKPDALKKVEVLDISNHIAVAKITAWWGIDYALLSRKDDTWIIEEVLWEGPLENNNDLSISYLGNMGVLISHTEGVVVIDGFHKKYRSEYVYPSEKAVKEIITGNYSNHKAPNLALITHKHRDHFDPEYYKLFLHHNKESLIVAPDQVVNLIKVKIDDDKIHRGIKPITYDDKEHLVTHNGIKVQAFKCRHINPSRHALIENMAYIVSLDNFSILHLGDTSWDMLIDDIKEKQLSEMELDAVILPYWMLTEKNSIEKIDRLINPKNIIATHIPSNYNSNKLSALIKKHTNIILFSKPNQQIKLNK